MALVFEQWLQFIGKHFIIYDDNNINFEMLDYLCQTLRCAVILRCESINDASTCKCLGISWSYKSFEFFFVYILKLFCLLTWHILFWLLDIDHVLLIKKFKIVLKP